MCSDNVTPSRVAGHRDAVIGRAERPGAALPKSNLVESAVRGRAAAATV